MEHKKKQKQKTSQPALRLKLPKWETYCFQATVKTERKDHYRDLPMTASDVESLPEAECEILVRERGKIEGHVYYKPLFLGLF